MLTSANIPFPHGFFTRNGGVSEGIYASLNGGYGSGDDKEKVRENRLRAAAMLGVRREPVTLYQVHSANAVTVEAPLPQPVEADALVTATPGLLIGVLTADCAPVLLADREARVAAAAHAGWKGALGGIVQNTVACMEKLGARRERIFAAIGPCIGQSSYEVGPEFVARLVEASAANARFFTAPDAQGKAFFDLKLYVKNILQLMEIEDINVLPQDTFAAEDTFFSYRRATLRRESAYGRQMSCITVE